MDKGRGLVGERKRYRWIQAKRQMDREEGLLDIDRGTGSEQMCE